LRFVIAAESSRGAGSARKSAKDHARTNWHEEVWARLSGDIMFVPGSFDDDEAFDTLAQTLADLCASHGIQGNAAFYLSVPPSMFPDVLKQMQRTGLSDAAAAHGDDDALTVKL